MCAFNNFPKPETKAKTIDDYDFNHDPEIESEMSEVGLIRALEDFKRAHPNLDVQILEHLDAIQKFVNGYFTTWENK